MSFYLLYLRITFQYQSHNNESFTKQISSCRIMYYMKQLSREQEKQFNHFSKFSCDLIVLYRTLLKYSPKPNYFRPYLITNAAEPRPNSDTSEMGHRELVVAVSWTVVVISVLLSASSLRISTILF